MLYRYPPTAKVDKVIAKNKFYQQGHTSRHTERLFIEQVESIRWAYKLSPHTINLADSDTVKEIQIVSIVSRVEKLDTQILQFIDKLIPSPIVFEIVFNNKIKTTATYKRQNQSDNQKVVLAKYYTTDWQDPAQREDLPIVSDMADLYEHFIERLIASTHKTIENKIIKNNAINKTSLDFVSPSKNADKRYPLSHYPLSQKNDSIENKIAYAEKVARLTKQIKELQKRIYKEKQFNRQVEMNLQLQTLQKQLNELSKI